MTDSRASLGARKGPAVVGLTLVLVAAPVGLPGLHGQETRQQKPTVPVEDYGK